MTRYLLQLLAAAGFLMLGAGAPHAQEGEAHALPENDQCVVCHQELDDELGAPVALYRYDVHLGAGLACSDCHGGDPASDDPDVSMDPKKGFVGRPDPLKMPAFCDRCHGDAAYMRQYNPGLPVDQLIKYRTSVHGIKNAEGDRKAAQCASCHPPHNIKKANDPTSSVYALNIPETCGHCHGDAEYMAEYGIPTNQYDQYAASVHGDALLNRHDVGAPACNDCHGNHAASPPITGSIANVCGNCHAFNAELFAASPHRQAYEEAGIPACEICHDHHAIRQLTAENLGAGPEAICLECHDADDGTRGVNVAVAMKAYLDSLESSYHVADSLLQVAERKGMYVDDAHYALNDARQATIQAHTLIHSFSDSIVKAKVDSGLVITASVTGIADEKIAESQFRRWGLGVSTLIISFLVVGLWLKIRSMERK